MLRQGVCLSVNLWEMIKSFAKISGNLILLNVNGICEIGVFLEVNKSSQDCIYPFFGNTFAKVLY